MQDDNKVILEKDETILEVDADTFETLVNGESNKLWQDMFKLHYQLETVKRPHPYPEVGVVVKFLEDDGWTVRENRVKSQEERAKEMADEVTGNAGKDNVIIDTVFDDVQKGGAGSGHWGHKGVKGQRGGSAKGALSKRKFNWEDNLNRPRKELMKDVIGAADAFERKVKTYSDAASKQRVELHRICTEQIDIQNKLAFASGEKKEKLQKRYDKLQAEGDKRVQIANNYYNKAAYSRKASKEAVLSLIQHSDGKKGGDAKILSTKGFGGENKKHRDPMKARMYSMSHEFAKMMSPEVAKRFMHEGWPKSNGSPKFLLYGGSTVPTHRREWLKQSDGSLSLLQQYIIVGVNADEKSWIHELGHTFDNVGDIGEAALEFWEERTKNDEYQPLSKYTGETFHDDTHVKRDKFYNPYTGRGYKREGEDKYVATELVSTGMEELYQGNVDFFKKDPEHAEFMLSILRGEHREFMDSWRAKNMEKREKLYKAIKQYNIVDLNYKIDKVLKGGKGSGHWGHKGVKGQRGGSSPTGGTGATRDFMARTPEKKKQIMLERAQEKIRQRAPEVMDEVRTWDAYIAAGHTSLSDNQVDGKYPENRQKVHQSIVKQFTGKKGKEGVKPKLVLFGGASGSGKGGLLRMMGDKAKDFNYVNNDDIKAALPEYNGKNAGYLHHEARDIVNEIEEQVIADRGNIIIDGTLKDKKKALKIINKYKDLGYEVELMATNLPLDEVLNRNLGRLLDAGEEGRYVPLELVVETAEEANINQFEILEHVDRGAIYDTHVKKGQSFELIQEKGGEKK